jgi:hypothetical protein
MESFEISACKFKEVSCLSFVMAENSEENLFSHGRV